MTFTVTSNSFKDGDYLGKDHILSSDFGFGAERATVFLRRVADRQVVAGRSHPLMPRGIGKPRPLGRHGGGRSVDGSWPRPFPPLRNPI